MWYIIELGSITLHSFLSLEHLHSHCRLHAAHKAVVKEATAHRYRNVSVPGELLMHPKLTTETDMVWRPRTDHLPLSRRIISFINREPNKQL